MANSPTRGFSLISNTKHKTQPLLTGTAAAAWGEGMHWSYRQWGTNLEFLHVYSSQRKCEGSSKSASTQTSKSLDLPQPAPCKADASVLLQFA